MDMRQWQSPKTTRIYLHMPLAERIVVLSPDFKIVNASLKPDGGHLNQPAIGLRVLLGQEALAPDFRQTTFSPVQPGRAIYAMNNRAGSLDIRMEAFCSGDRNPAAYFRLEFTNIGSEIAEETVTLLCRSGLDAYLSCLHLEGYGVYSPNEKTWYMCERTWKRSSDVETVDLESPGVLRLKLSDNLTSRFIEGGYDKPMFEASDCFRVECRLHPGESAYVEGAFRAEASVPEFDYQAEKAAAEAAWDHCMAGLAVEPDTTDEPVRSAFRHLCMQMLQMLARYEGMELVAPRQGDFGRGIWPFEATILLEALDTVGLDHYTASAYRYLISTLMQTEGEDKGRVGGQNAWENFTAATLWGLSEHILHTNDPQELNEFLPALLSMFHWIERRRETEGEYRGLFPPAKGSDWPDVARFWTFTDAYNAMAERSLTRLLRRFDRPEGRETGRAYADYEATILRVRDALYAGHEVDEAYILPHELGVPFEKAEQYSYYTDGAPILLFTGFMDAKSRMRRQMETFFRRRGQFDHGLTGRMTDRSAGYDSMIYGYGDVWYTQIGEYYWIRTWLEAGEVEKAEETVRALMKYGMSSEFVTAERYCSIEPYYSPWQPNGSGSARMVKSLLCFFGEKRRETV